MNKARQILTSRRESRPGSRTLVLIASRQSSPAAESTLTPLQVRACLDEIHRAEGFWVHAMANFARMLSAQEGLSQRLHVLLGDAIAKASAR